MVKKAKSLIGVALSIILLAAVVWVVLTEGYANGVLRRVVQDELTQRLGKTVSFSDIQGNPLHRYQIIGVEVSNMVRIDTIDVVYRLHNLLLGQAIVDTLFLRGMVVEMATVGDNGDVWWTLEPQFAFEIRSLEISRGEVRIDSTLVKGIALAGQVSAGADGYRILLERFRSIQFDPPLEIANLAGIGILKDGDLHLDRVELATHQSRISLSGKIAQLADPVLDLVVEADSLSLGDLNVWPDLSSRTIWIQGEVKGGLQALVVKANMGMTGVQAALNGNLTVAPFEANGQMEFSLVDFSPADWGAPKDLGVAFDLDGSGTVALDYAGVRELGLEGVVRQLRLGTVQFDSVQISSALTNGMLAVELRAAGGSGKLHVKGQMDPNTLSGKWSAGFNGLNLSHFPGVPEWAGLATGHLDLIQDDGWHSTGELDLVQIGASTIQRLNFGADFKGEKVNVTRLEAEVNDLGLSVTGVGQIDIGSSLPRLSGQVAGVVRLSELIQRPDFGTSLRFASAVDGELGKQLNFVLAGSVLGNPIVDSMTVTGIVENTQISDVQVSVSGPAGVLSGVGQMGFDGHIGANWQVVVSNPEVIGQVVGFDLLGESTTLTGASWGQWAAPGFSVRGNAESLTVNGIPLQMVDLETRWIRPDSGAVLLTADGVEWGGQQLGGVIFSAAHHQGKTEFLLSSDSGLADRIYFWGNTKIMDDGFLVAMDSLHIQAEKVALYNEGPIQFAYSPTKGIQIDHFSIAGPAGRIEAQDQTDFQATIGVVLTELDLKPWAFLMGISNVAGVVNGELDVAGALSDPLVFGVFTLFDGLFNGVQIKEAGGEVSFGDGRALIEASVVSDRGKSLDLAGSFSVKNAGDLRLRARSDGVELSTLDTLWQGAGKMEGLLSLDVEVRGSFDKPELHGRLALENGILQISSLKRSFSPVSAQVLIHDGQVQIDTLVLGKPDNGAAMQGVIRLDGFVPASWDLAVNFTNFDPVAWPELRVRTDGRLQLTGTPNAPHLAGKLQMKQADIRLADLLASPESIWESSAFLKALTMNVEVAADRQVWVRDPTFNVELTGDVDVTKDEDGVRMYGSMESRRGNYILQNRRLRIEQGDIQFRGRPEINPDLNIEAETQVRAVVIESGESEPVTVRVTVGGTLSHPQVEMTSEPSFSELDIVALLVTGHASGLFDFSGEDAMNVVLGFAANRLGQRIGQELNLDLVEVDVGQANISRIRVGKYLGSRLFVSYAQDISTTARDVAIEFEVLPGLTVEGLHAEDVDEETNNRRTRESLGLFWKKEW